MRVEAVELRRIRMPLVTPFRTSTGTVSAREALLVQVHTDGADGWGECVAMQEPTYSAEYVDGAAHMLRHHLVPRLLAADVRCGEDVATALSPLLGHPMAKAAIEAAVLDAQLRIEGRSLAEALGGTRAEVEAGVAVGIARSLPDLVHVLRDYVAEGYRRVKLKVEPGWDVEPVRAVREALPELRLQVDANGAYTLGDTDHLRQLDDFALTMLEQPLAADDLVGHATLAREVQTPICLDESVTSAGTAAAAIALGACSVVNVKPGRVGGLFEARRIHDLCVSEGVGLWVGGMLETGVGRAANVALASLPGFTHPGDLSASSRYYAADITPPFTLDDGLLTVPDGPGIGVEPLLHVVDEVTISRDIVR